MTLPPLSAQSSLDITDFRKGINQMQADLRSLADVARRVGTIKITTDLSAGKDAQKMVRAVRDAVLEAVPTDMQRRIDTTFGAFDVGVGQAARSAAVFEAQASALRARIQELERAVRITRAEFQTGLGEASKEEVAKLSAEMERLQGELGQVGQEAKENFGQYSREAQQVANANRLAATTAAAARGEISRLGLASQVKLGVGGALQQIGPQANFAAVGLFGLAQASDQARISQGLFEKTVQKSGQSSTEAQKAVAALMDTLQVSRGDAEEAIRGLLRQGYTLAQAQEALTGAGASALAFGRSAAEGMSAFVDASASMSSAALNNIGIGENLSTFYQRYAQKLGKTTDELTKQEKAEAELSLIRAATSDEVGDLTALLGGMAGESSSAARELGEAQKELGQVLVPLATNGIRTLTAFLDVFNDLPEPIKTTVTLLGASAVAVGVLAAPVGAVVSGVRGLTEGLGALRGGAAATAAATGAAAEAGESLASAAGGAAGGLADATSVAQNADGWYGRLNTRLTASVAAHLAAGGSANVMSASFLRAVGSTVLLDTALGALTITAAATLAGVGLLAAGVGAYSVKLIKDTQKIYDEIDAIEQKSFDGLMKRVAELRGTELGNAQARALLLQRRLQDEQQGTFQGTDLFGNRIYSKPDEARIKQLQADLAAARENVTLLYTEAQRRGQLNLKLTEEQTEAVKVLKDTLGEREFELKLSGLTEMQADLTRLGKDFDQLRAEFKKPFYVNGQLQDPGQTPALREGLAALDAQRLAEEAQVRKRYADQAAEAARESALKVQRAEIDAMQEGRAQRRALREAEVAEIRREAGEKAASLGDFPKVAAQVEADARRVIAARRRQWVQEDAQLAREGAERVASAQRGARDAAIGAMQSGYAKEEALRRAALSDLRRDIAERVRLESDPRVRGQLQAAGNSQVAALEQQQAAERERSLLEAGQRVAEAVRRGREAAVSALRDGVAKEEALRALELGKLRADVAERVRLAAATPGLQAAEQQAGAQEIAALIERQAQARAQAVASAERVVRAAEKSARDASLAAMASGYAKEVALREAALGDLRTSLEQGVADFQGSEEQRQQLVVASNRQMLTLYQRQQAELREIREGAVREVLDAEREARAAEVSALQDEGARRRAERAQELTELQAQTAERLRTFQGTEAQAQAIRDAAHRVQAARQQEWAAEDLRQARQTALTIARAWEEAWSKQVAAQQAGRAAALAQYNLGVSRSLAGAEGNSLRQAQIEQEAGRRRAQLAQEDAAARLAEEQRRLTNSRRLALAEEGLTAQQVEAIWTGYYAERDRLSSQFQADETQRLQQQEEQERQAAEKVRQARLAEANRPVEQSRDRVQDLEQARALALTDAETLALNRQISAERDSQLRALQAQLDGSSGLVLSAEEREAVEGQIRDLQHEQAVSLRDQQVQARELAQARLSLLGAGARLAEQLARTEAQSSAAQRQQLAVLQASLRSLDDEIAGEGREKERLALLERRLSLLGEIDDLSGKIARAPLEAEGRRLELYQAQARAELELRGLGEDRAAAAALATQIASQELLLANTRVAAARTEVELQAALVGQAGARVGLAQALREQGGAGQNAPAVIAEQRRAAEEALSRQLKLQGDLLDAEEARARALLALRGEGDDAVAQAELELSLTRQRLALTREQLATPGLSPDQSGDLARRNLDLLTKQLEAERRLGAAQRERRALLLALGEAERTLREEASGRVASPVGEAERELERARLELERAQGDYAGAGTNLARRREAAEALTQAIRARREATLGLIEAQVQERRTAQESAATQRDLAQALAGADLTGPQAALRGLADARQALTRAEEEYALARQVAERLPSTDNTERLRAATEGLTGAVQAQRSAVTGLAESYRQQIQNMEGVRDSAERLRSAAYGEQAPFDTNTELRRLRAIQGRRDAAQRELQLALDSGEAARIAQASQRLAAEQERYSAQAKALEERGLGRLFSRQGDGVTRQLADTVDALGIQYDAEAVALEERARLLDREAGNAFMLSEAATRFDQSVAALVSALEQPVPLAGPSPVSGLRPAQPELEAAADTLRLALETAARAADREAQASARGAPLVTPLSAADLDRIAKASALAVGPQGKTLEDIRSLLAGPRAEVPALPALLVPPAVPAPPMRELPAPNHTFNYTVGDIVIHAPSDRAADLAAAARAALNDALSEARRERAWSGDKC